ncbi:hypothetical protein NDU88_010280 [Pleurodeles waltl]|uniref:Uncharacterized protein n=1 Tax=Pleurodeles waltl TaxID=8319 RepID=A0AAV7PY88_PLEWA|nr:hypothetical protein NDU88_010280 [Pleurodeles waltl]
MGARTGVVVSDETWRLDEEEKIKARKEYFDRRKSTRTTKVKVGDWVLIRKPVAKRLLTRRWKATTAPTTTQWKAEVIEWGKAEGEALRREDNSGMRECPVAPDWDALMENFETLSEEEDE